MSDLGDWIEKHVAQKLLVGSGTAVSLTLLGVLGYGLFRLALAVATNWRGAAVTLCVAGGVLSFLWLLGFAVIQISNRLFLGKTDHE